MDTTGRRLGVLCVALGLAMSACGAPDPGAPDLRTPPARETPTGTVGNLAGDGADSIGGAPAG